MERFKKTGTTHALVCCFDFKLDAGLRRVITENGIVEPDPIRLPGGVGNFASIPLYEFADSIFNAICFAIAKHGVKNIVMLSHQQCGAYKECGHAFPSHTLTGEEREFHLRELLKAEKNLRDRLDERAFQKITIQTGFLWVDAQDVLYVEWVKIPDANQMSFADVKAG